MLFELAETIFYEILILIVILDSGNFSLYIRQNPFFLVQKSTS